MAFPVTLQWGNFTEITFLRKNHSLLRGFFRLFKRRGFLQLKTAWKEPGKLEKLFLHVNLINSLTMIYVYLPQKWSRGVVHS